MIDNGGSNGIYFARLVRLPDEGIVVYMVTNESSINTNMLLPKVSQLLISGKIDEQTPTAGKFETPEGCRDLRYLDVQKGRIIKSET